MINPKYAVKCLKLGFLRYQRNRKLHISVEVSDNTISFYVKNRTMERGKNARVSNHHLSIQRFAEKNQPWLCDNLSIVFIAPESPEDKSPRARVYQNAEGSIKEFDVTIYLYNPNVLEPNDISVIFQAIAKYLESGEYIDPFKGTDKESEPIPRHSNIKPYKGKVKKLGEGVVRLDNVLLNEIGKYCVNQYLLLNEHNQINCNKNMNTNRKNVVRLTESKLRGMIQEAVNGAMAQRKPMRKANPKRLTENRLRVMIQESVKEILREEGKPGSLIHGTLRNEDLIPTFMSEIFRNDPKKAREIWKSSPNLLQALCDKNAGINTNWWDSEEATEISMELQYALQEYAPEGHYFGSHIGDGSDFGYWNDEE